MRRKQPVGPPDWAWRSGGLPDEHVCAEFVAADAGRLAAVLAAEPLPGLLPDPLRDEGELAWIDGSTHTSLVGQLQAGERRNVYVYDEVRLDGSTLTMTRGYGGVGGDCGHTETALLTRLAEALDLTVERWQVCSAYFGEVEEGAAGTTSASLLAYLGGPATWSG